MISRRRNPGRQFIELLERHGIRKEATKLLREYRGRQRKVNEQLGEQVWITIIDDTSGDLQVFANRSQRTHEVDLVRYGQSIVVEAGFDDDYRGTTNQEMLQYVLNGDDGAFRDVRVIYSSLNSGPDQLTP